MSYVDGFVIVVPRDRLDDYYTMARAAGEVWKEYGALSYRECQADDLNTEGGCLSFNTLANASSDEVVIFSYIEYQSREHRDQVNAKVMQDPRIKESCGNSETMPFDPSRMAYGGFKTIIKF